MSRLSFVFVAGLAFAQAGCLQLPFGFANGPPVEPGLLPAAETASLRVSTADKLAASGHHVEAVRQLQEARQLDPKVDVSPLLARLHAKLGNDADALNEFDLAVKAHPADAGLYNDLGYYHYERGNWAEAEKSLRIAVELEPALKRGWMNLGMALAQKGDFVGGLAAFEKAARPAEARCNLAFIAMTRGKHEVAKQHYEDAARLDPGLKQARDGLERVSVMAAKTGG